MRSMTLQSTKYYCAAGVLQMVYSFDEHFPSATTAHTSNDRTQVYEEAQRVFSAMLDRQQKAERIKSVVAMLKRYETVFRLPTRIRQATERGKFEQVIAEHRKAKALMETLAASSSEVWRNLFAEVEKVWHHPPSTCSNLHNALPSLLSWPAPAIRRPPHRS